MLDVWEAPRLNAKKRLPDSVISHSINMAIYKVDYKVDEQEDRCLQRML